MKYLIKIMNQPYLSSLGGFNPFVNYYSCLNFLD